jgi:hypothetical protein
LVFSYFSIFEVLVFVIRLFQYLISWFELSSTRIQILEEPVAGFSQLLFDIYLSESVAGFSQILFGIVLLGLRRERERLRTKESGWRKRV